VAVANRLAGTAKRSFVQDAGMKGAAAAKLVEKIDASLMTSSRFCHE
jgi:hypothetical protein